MSEQNNEQAVYVVDDDAAMLDSLRFLIESINVRVVTFESAEAFLEALSPEMSGCLIADLRLPGPMTGLDMHDKMLHRGTHLPTIIITAHGDVPHAVRAFKSGAIDFIQKPLSNSNLVDQVRSAFEQDRRQRAASTRQDAVRGRWDRLSRREQQVMNQIATGKSNKQAALALHLSPKTIEVHRASVMNKMEAQSLPELVRMSVTLTEHKSQTG